MTPSSTVSSATDEKKIRQKLALVRQKVALAEKQGKDLKKKLLKDIDKTRAKNLLNSITKFK